MMTLIVTNESRRYGNMLAINGHQYASDDQFNKDHPSIKDGHQNINSVNCLNHQGNILKTIFHQTLIVIPIIDIHKFMKRF